MAKRLHRWRSVVSELCLYSVRPVRNSSAHLSNLQCTSTVFYILGRFEPCAPSSYWLLERLLVNAFTTNALAISNIPTLVSFVGYLALVGHSWLDLNCLLQIYVKLYVILWRVFTKSFYSLGVTGTLIQFLLEPKMHSGKPACEHCHFYDISGSTTGPN